MKLAPPFRRAAPEDSRTLADLVTFASEGLTLYLWRRMAEPGEDAMAVGARRARREEGSFSYRNAVLIERDGRVAAGLIGYLLPDPPAPIDYAKTPAMFVGLQELENLAPGTWYVNVLAAYPEFRGQGLGSELLRLVEELAREADARGMSLIVSDANRGGRRLYERHGYREVATRRKVKEDWDNEGTDWVLMTKPL